MSKSSTCPEFFSNLKFTGVFFFFLRDFKQVGFVFFRLFFFFFGTNDVCGGKYASISILHTLSFFFFLIVFLSYVTFLYFLKLLVRF